MQTEDLETVRLIEKLQRQLEAAKETLIWYEDLLNYEERFLNGIRPISLDCGLKARDCLAKIADIGKEEG